MRVRGRGLHRHGSECMTRRHAPATVRSTACSRVGFRPRKEKQKKRKQKASDESDEDFHILSPHGQSDHNRKFRPRRSRQARCPAQSRMGSKLMGRSAKPQSCLYAMRQPHSFQKAMFLLCDPMDHWMIVSPVCAVMASERNAKEKKARMNEDKLFLEFSLLMAKRPSRRISCTDQLLVRTCRLCSTQASWRSEK